MERALFRSSADEVKQPLMWSQWHRWCEGTEDGRFQLTTTLCEPNRDRSRHSMMSGSWRRTLRRLGERRRVASYPRALVYGRRSVIILRRNSIGSSWLRCASAAIRKILSARRASLTCPNPWHLLPVTDLWTLLPSSPGAGQWRIYSGMTCGIWRNTARCVSSLSEKTLTRNLVLIGSRRQRQRSPPRLPSSNSWRRLAGIMASSTSICAEYGPRHQALQASMAYVGGAEPLLYARPTRAA